LKVAVTGGTGFVGSHLLPALVQEGHEVVCTVRPGTSSSTDGVRAVRADVGTGEGIERALAGAEAVVHLAALTRFSRDGPGEALGEYRRVNVEGTEAVARAALSCGARIFVHASSVKAMGEGSEEVLDESSPCAPDTPYAKSKLESEGVVREVFGGAGRCAAVLRLPMVYGPGDRWNLPRMIRWAEKGLPFPLVRPDPVRSLIYAGNVAAGIAALLSAPPAGFSVFLTTDGEDRSTSDLYSAVCRELGREPRFLPVPAVAARIGRRFSRDLRRLTTSFRVSSAKIEREIGFVPPVSFDEGLARTVEWYRRSPR
jgi:nucleoside-diphosphate-sugar epimerase